MAPAFCNPLPRPPRKSWLLLEVRQGYSREQPSPVHQPDSFPEQVHPVHRMEEGSYRKKNQKPKQHVIMWFSTIKLRSFLTRGQTKEICKDELSFDNPWLGHCYTGKMFAFTTSRNTKLRHQTLSHWHLWKTAVGLKSLDVLCSFRRKVISNCLQMWNYSLHGN